VAIFRYLYIGMLRKHIFLGGDASPSSPWDLRSRMYESSLAWALIWEVYHVSLVSAAFRGVGSRRVQTIPAMSLPGRKTPAVDGLANESAAFEMTMKKIDLQLPA